MEGKGAGWEVGRRRGAVEGGLGEGRGVGEGSGLAVAGWAVGEGPDGEEGGWEGGEWERLGEEREEEGKKDGVRGAMGARRQPGVAET